MEIKNGEKISKLKKKIKSKIGILGIYNLTKMIIIISIIITKNQFQTDLKIIKIIMLCKLGSQIRIKKVIQFIHNNNNSSNNMVSNKIINYQFLKIDSFQTIGMITNHSSLLNKI